ncbi:MAG: MBL fold metallo-hydrolase [Alphaproteobacteria bacterium]|nr:MBL fold metallo-hydrolase [Alphaproteobacteria bacterium]
MNRAIILGSGAAPGVPTISDGWGDCNPHNPKNRRTRAGVYVEINNVKILIDTSADIRNQLLDNDIHTIDAVLYTHAHADHIMGIDDLRALTYHHKQGLNIYGAKPHIEEIRNRFDYVFTDIPSKETTQRPQLISNVIEYGQEFYVGNLKIMPLEFAGHPVPTTGYSLDDGRLILVPDYKIIPLLTLEYLQKIDVNVLIMPLTNLETSRYHAGKEDNLMYIQKIRPQRVFWTHMSPKCDYDNVMRISPANTAPAYDGLEIEL